nr:hypothetical protein [Porphyromonas sp. COT-239 OH1446]
MRADMHPVSHREHQGCHGVVGRAVVELPQDARHIVLPMRLDRGALR